ncbi:MAG: alpha-L-fucosidase [Cellulosilyticaceae bacterium]
MENNNYKVQIPSEQPTEAQVEQIKRQFGMFIHFGINTFNNTEWSDGTLPLESYKPTEICAEEWVKTAYEAGMNYVILITKHHDGFCLWPTKYTDYAVTNTSNQTDVVKAVSEACKKYGLKLGLYYSLWDRHEPTYINDFDEGYVPYMCNQLTELLDGTYGEVIELWLDGAWDYTCEKWQLDRVYDVVKRLQPNCQIGVNHTIGDRTLTGVPDTRYRPENYELYDPIKQFPSDFRLWDPFMCREENDPKLYTFEGNTYYMPFEMTICSREEFSWFYCDEYEAKPLINPETIIKNYTDLVKQDNLLVINLPPNKEGHLVQSDVDNLLYVSRKLGIAREI